VGGSRDRWAGDAIAHIIMKLVFNFKWVVAPGGRMPDVPEALDVTCPCCGALLKIDPEVGSVVWVDKKKEPAKDLDDLVNRVRSHRSTLDEKFARSVHQAKHAREILEKKFEEAKKRAAADPTGRPPHPFVNE
jgi:hypothetical protein